MAAETPQHYFIAVQLELKDNHTPPIKMRTDLAQLTHRPKFKRNLFSFDKLIEHQTLKFGLMACPGGSEDNIVKHLIFRIMPQLLGWDRLVLALVGSGSFLKKDSQN